MIFPDYIQEFDAMQMGKRIQEVRNQKGIKAIDMAMQLDMSTNQYSRIECGYSVCTTKVLHKIAQYLEVSADYLLYGGEENEYIKQLYKLIKGKQPKEIEKMLQVMQIMAS
ncbi:MAG: helix-turn-helix transcriptional regulator [Lachnospiraceae bacterium]|nr:helix-turn-helix transcriptional regulator [Lachnospiraceae bacterium]